MTERLYAFADRQAAARPDATAVVMEEERLTYRELAKSSDRLALRLHRLGCQPGDRVALLMPKSPTAIVAMHAVNKIGAAYVPVDAASPAVRVARVLAASEPRWILAGGPVAALLADSLADYPHTRPGIGWLDERSAPGVDLSVDLSPAALRAMAEGPLPAPEVSSDIAHLLFTSGSTGVPKGVVITHANVIAFVEWAVEYFSMDATDRVSGHSPFHFDLSTFDIFGAFCAGAELHLVPPSLNLMAPKTAAFIRDSRLTQWFSVPSALSYMAKFDVIEQSDFPDLKQLLWCGEVFPTPPLIHWMERLPHVRFTNLYGPTETTIASSYHTLDAVPADPTMSLPIGRACRGESLFVLDDELAAVDNGEVGDLYVGGVGLSPGYWRDPQMTAQGFRESADGERIYRTGDRASIGADGLVYFHGRADTQIKSRGHRIELGEIEAALSTLDSLRENAVVALPTDGFEGYSICCAYVVTDDEISPVELRRTLGSLVPSYMVPSRWLVMDRLPKNANGKIDKPAIRARFASEA